jgi:hypothetical protein
MTTLFPGERLISQSIDGDVNLTTHRILYEHKSWGQSSQESILLEDIIFCENKPRKRQQAWLVALGVLLIIVAIFITSAKIIALLVGSFCLAIYWKTEKEVLVVASAETKIKIRVEGMRQQKIIEFVNKIEQARGERIIDLNNCTV